MSTYVIGDLQGCLNPLKKLLRKIKYKSDRDQIWFTGDLVNRGPQSLETLRFVKSLDANAVTVLGNHDLHLLAIAHGYAKPHKKDTIGKILTADDADRMLTWLQHQPLIHYDAEINTCLIHAGLPPQWDIHMACACAAEVNDVLSGKHFARYFKKMYGNEPDIWSENLQNEERLRFITNCFTRLRYCDRNGKLALDEKGPIGTQAKSLIPWFQVPNRKSLGVRILFGHWSTLGRVNWDPVFALDSGCVWGRRLTAICLEDLQITEVECDLAQVPSGRWNQLQ